MNRIVSYLAIIVLLIASTINAEEWQDEDYFKYKFTGPESAIIMVNGEKYHIKQNDINDGRPYPDLPFSYEFEDDGDVDIELYGRRYDLDNPADDFNDMIEDLFESSKKKSTTKKIYVAPVTPNIQTTKPVVKKKVKPKPKKKPKKKTKKK